MKDYRVTTLDRRHNGYSFYKYSISPNTVNQLEGQRLLIQLRNWLWENYGPGAELGWTQRGDIWAWDTEHGHRRIYIKSDAELTFLELKFS